MMRKKWTTKIGSSLIALLLTCSVYGQGNSGVSSRNRNVPEKAIRLKSRTIVPLKEGYAEGLDFSSVATEKKLAKGEKADKQLKKLKQAVKSRSKRTRALVQFQEHPSVSQRKELEKKGIKLLQYVSGKAWLVSINPEAADQLETQEIIRWGDTLKPEDRVAPGLAKKGVPDWARENGRIRLTVKVFRDASVETLGDKLSSQGITILSADDKLKRLTLEGPENLVDLLLAENDVEYIDHVPPPPMVINDDVRQNTGAEALQSLPHNLSGEGIRVGIWDGGLPYVHQDFDTRVIAGRSSGVHYHATHVAGIVGGSGLLSQDKGGTPFQWRGMAPKAQFVCYDYKNFPASEHNIALTAYHIDLSQNSWGFPVGWDARSETDLGNRKYFGDYTEMALDFDSIVTGIYGPKIPVCFAMGNDRSDVNTNGVADPLHPLGYMCVAPPATAKNIISVGAVADDDTMTSFSNWGPTDDGRLKPEIVAPGLYMKSTVPNDEYGISSGTSMACPVVSGALALLMERVNALYPGLDLLPSTYKALLAHTAVDLGNVGPDYKYGYGRIDAGAADEIVRNAGFIEAAIPESGQTDTYTVTIASGTPTLKITLVWDDPPATPLSEVTLINDLDLKLIAPDSTEYFPWVLDPDNPDAAAGTGVNVIDIMEQVLVVNPAPGEWTVEVAGTVPQAPQMYSLISDRFEGEVNAQILIVNNDGGEELTITDVTHSSPWLSVGTTAFSVSPGKSGGILISVSPAGLAEGTYNDTVEISSDDPVNPLVSIPVSFSIAEANLPPDAPHTPLPLDNALNQPLALTLSWLAEDADSSELSYDVYFGQTSGDLALSSQGQALSRYACSGLTFDADYYWQIVARDERGLATAGPEWTFQTFSATGDQDGDGLNNQDELDAQTNPYLTDTDGDGWTDKEELSMGSDPLDFGSTPQSLIELFFEDFDDGLLNEWTQYSDLTSAWELSGTASSAPYSLALTGGDDGASGWYAEVISGMIVVEPDTYYRLSAEMRGEGKFIVYEYDQFGQFVRQQETPSVDFADFDLLTHLFQTDIQTVFVQIAPVALDGAAVYFDDMKLSRTSALMIYFD